MSEKNLSMNDSLVLDKFQEIQKELSIKQKQLENKEFIFEFNGGEVVVTMMGNKKLVKIDFSDSLLKNKSSLLDMLKNAMNAASENIDREIQTIINEIWQKNLI
ncbi:MAG: YbaB/EbfC family nucleoid-associated protein [Mycoplasma sp.]